MKTTIKFLKAHRKIQWFLYTAVPHDKAGPPTDGTRHVVHVLQLSTQADSGKNSG